MFLPVIANITGHIIKTNPNPRPFEAIIRESADDGVIIEINAICENPDGIKKKAQIFAKPTSESDCAMHRP